MTQDRKEHKINEKINWKRKLIYCD